MPEPYQLPPLILHPFVDSAHSTAVLENAREAAEQLLAGDGSAGVAEILRERLAAGRYAELRMLLFVGKDIFRWLSQCVDFAGRDPMLRQKGYLEQTFAEFLIVETPEPVRTKLHRWGVADYARIFARAIGIHAQFQQPPPADLLNPDYLPVYFRYADYSYACWRDAVKFPVLFPNQFDFSLYASGEYSKLLEEHWQR